MRDAGATSHSEFSELWAVMGQIITDAWLIDISRTPEGRDMVVEKFGVIVLRNCLDSLNDEPTSGSSDSDEEWYRM